MDFGFLGPRKLRSASPASKCPGGRDCQRKPTTQTGRCRLHNAIAMLLEQQDLGLKAISELCELEREEAGDREEPES